MPEESVIVVDRPERNRFEVEIAGQTAFAEYRLVPGGIMFTHTEVPEPLGGRGLGKALVRAGLQAARERGLQVLPVCPFFANYMKDHPETHDLLHPDCRKALGL